MASKVLNPKSVRDTCLYVVNLNWTTGSNELKKHFIKFGKVIKSNVVFDRDTGLSKGYGFVRFEKYDSAEAALKADHALEGKKLFLTLQHQKKE